MMDTSECKDEKKTPVGDQKDTKMSVGDQKDTKMSVDDQQDTKMSVDDQADTKMSVDDVEVMPKECTAAQEKNSTEETDESRKRKKHRRGKPGGKKRKIQKAEEGSGECEDSKSLLNSDRLKGITECKNDNEASKMVVGGEQLAPNECSASQEKKSWAKNHRFRNRRSNRRNRFERKDVYVHEKSESKERRNFEHVKQSKPNMDELLGENALCHRVTEKDVGITEYIGKHKGFQGVLKQR